MAKRDKYRSGLEDTIGAFLPEEFQYECCQIAYKISRKYTPDFSYAGTHFECKGFFRPGDTAKYKAIRDHMPEGEELVFIFSDPDKKVRKGAKLTMGQWCEKEGINYFSAKHMDSLMDYIVEEVLMR